MAERRALRPIGVGGALIVLAGTALFAPPVRAAETAAGQGVGTYDCAEFARASRADSDGETLYFSWAQGWMTGWNLAKMDASKPAADLNSRSIEDEKAFLRTYCAAHPAALYMEAVYRLYASLEPAAK